MKRYLKVKNQLTREFLAETFGIFIMIVFGCGAEAQNVFSESNNILSADLAFGFGAIIAGL